MSGRCFDGDSATPSATPFPSIADSLRALPNPLAPASGRLAEADLWREAAETARLASADRELRWLSILVNRTAAARLDHAGSSSQPLLTHVLAGEYGPALDLMRAGGPLIADTEAEWSARVSGYLLDYTGRALEVRSGDAAIHAVRALGLALESPDDLSRRTRRCNARTNLRPPMPGSRRPRRSCGRRRANAQAQASTRGAIDTIARVRNGEGDADG